MSYARSPKLDFSTTIGTSICERGKFCVFISDECNRRKQFDANIHVSFPPLLYSLFRCRSEAAVGSAACAVYRDEKILCQCGVHSPAFRSRLSLQLVTAGGNMYSQKRKAGDHRLLSCRVYPAVGNESSLPPKSGPSRKARARLLPVSNQVTTNSFRHARVMRSRSATPWPRL